MDVAGAPGQTPKITIQEAVQAFLDDEKGRHLSKGTTGQSEMLLQKQLLNWAEQQGLKFLTELAVGVFRDSGLPGAKTSATGRTLLSRSSR
ncbi:MAG TPA: hypothetical protein VGK22_21510 [Candidatus Angelobacter sp.]